MENCRLCQLEKGIIQLDNDLTNKVYECTHITLNDNSHLPRKVCSTCRSTILVFYEFLQKVLTVNRQLQSTFTESTLERHKKETNSTVYECTLCTRKFFKQVQLEKHKKTHSNFNIVKNEPEINNSDNCMQNACQKVEPASADSLLLARDGKLANSLSPSEGQYQCTVCKQKFNFNDQLETHFKEHHVSSLLCTYENCKKKCTSVNSFQHHKMKHEGNLPFLCMACGKQFTNKNSLNSHERTHAEFKAFKCTKCSTAYFSYSNLRSHERKVHEGKRYYCSKCTNSYITKCNLERHELIHMGKKEFKCQICPGEFYTKKELAKHMRYHEGIRSYNCDVCFKSFFEKHHLIVHIRKHTGEKPYVCKVVGCGKSFSESQKLSRHAKTRHFKVE